MNAKDFYRLKNTYIEFLQSVHFDVFSTITLKQAIPKKDGTLQYITPEDIVDAANFIHERIGRRLSDKKHSLPFLVFCEGDGLIKRRHLHVASLKPENVTFEEYAVIFKERVARSRWVHKEINVLPVKNGDQKNVITYSLKEGWDAFFPEASFF